MNNSDYSFQKAQRAYDAQSPDDEEERQARRDRRRQWEEDHADEINDTKRDDHAAQHD
jgi:hypothetical protein